MAQNLSESMKIYSEIDIVNARIRARMIAESIGFSYMDQTRIATAVSELTRNAFQHAGGGSIRMSSVEDGMKRGIEIVVEDQGPGIADLENALKGGQSTVGGLGLGLSGSKRLMDEFDIQTKVGEGTKVTIRKWL